jgi:transposase
MGFFKDLEIEVIEMFVIDGVHESQIAKVTGLSLIEVYDILERYERSDYDYDYDYEE